MSFYKLHFQNIYVKCWSLEFFLRSVFILHFLGTVIHCHGDLSNHLYPDDFKSDSYNTNTNVQSHKSSNFLPCRVVCFTNSMSHNYKNECNFPFKGVLSFYHYHSHQFFLPQPILINYKISLIHLFNSHILFLKQDTHLIPWINALAF